MTKRTLIDLLTSLDVPDDIQVYLADWGEDYAAPSALETIRIVPRGYRQDTDTAPTSAETPFLLLDVEPDRLLS